MDVEPSLNPWEKSYIVIVYNTFNVSLHHLSLRSFASIFIRNIVIPFFMWYLWLVSGWCWLCWVSSEAFLPLQFFGMVLETWVLILLWKFDRIHLWNHLVLDFVGSFLIIDLISLVFSYFLFLPGSVLERFHLLKNLSISSRLSILLA